MRILKNNKKKINCITTADDIILISCSSSSFSFSFNDVHSLDKFVTPNILESFCTFWNFVQAVTGRKNQPANKQLIARPTTAAPVTVLQKRRRLSNVWLPRYRTAHMHTHKQIEKGIITEGKRHFFLPYLVDNLLPLQLLQFFKGI